MKPKSLLKQVTDIAGEERSLIDFKEIPCKDMDIDCLASDGKIPFGSYKRCYEYAPELGKCVFYEWHKDRSAARD
jgi:hypothetical protein